MQEIAGCIATFSAPSFCSAFGGPFRSPIYGDLNEICVGDGRECAERFRRFLNAADAPV